jgi:hypothetical protein
MLRNEDFKIIKKDVRLALRMNNISVPYMPFTLDNLEIKSTNILEGRDKVYLESLSQFKLSPNLQCGLHLRQGDRHKYQF